MEMNEETYGAGPAGTFVSRLCERDHQDLLALASRRPLHKGTLIFQAGDPSTHVYMLETGRAKIFHLSPAGKEVLLWFCFPGELFGLAEIFQDEERQASAQVCEHSTLLRISREDFRGFVEQRPAVARQVIDLLASRVRDLGRMMQELVANDVTGRVMTLLARLTSRYGRRMGDEVCLDVHITHQEMADMIGTTRQTVTSTLSVLKRSGALNFRNRRIYITNRMLQSGLPKLPAASII